jgi:EAL domain-containing protein (putative c-di-GMP-specific phosphodiesterase class I)
VDNEEFTLVYQPMVAFGPPGAYQVEALIRWTHATRGAVPPTEFIAFAETTGYVRAITQWVLKEAIARCAAWRREAMPIEVSVNLSARDVMDAELPDKLAMLLGQHGCAAQWISLEITEGSLLDDPNHAIRNLERLHALGCRLAIDDFGTGYSSLSYLRRLPVNTIKIDKSFVTGMVRDSSDTAIVRSTIDLAHHMGLTVVAEGIEDEVTFEHLRAYGCDAAQGFWISRPLAAADVPAYVHRAGSRVLRSVG